MSFSLVANLADLWPGEIKGVKVEDRLVLLVRLKATPEVLAYQGECPHQKVSLSDGHFDGQVLTCSAHQWQFDLQTGQGMNPTCTRLKKFPVLIEGDYVFVDADEKGPLVGPTVQSSAMGQAVVTAISEQNSDVRVLDRGSYLRVEAPSPCRLSRPFLERHWDRAIEFPGDIELILSSFKGRMTLNADQITWNALGERP